MPLPYVYIILLAAIIGLLLLANLQIDEIISILKQIKNQI